MPSHHPTGHTVISEEIDLRNSAGDIYKGIDSSNRLNSHRQVLVGCRFSEGRAAKQYLNTA